MTDPLAETLAAHFRSDAEALRARASVLQSRGPAARGGGPDAASCRRMADACDRVVQVFVAVDSIDALANAGRALDRLHADEPSGDARHVYAGAIARLRQAMDGNGADDDELEDDLENEIEDDDDLDDVHDDE